MNVGGSYTKKCLKMSLKELHERFYDPRKMKESYLEKESAFFEDTVPEMFSNVIKIYASGDVKGDSLIGLSYGPHIYYTLPACEYFNEITFACADDKSIQETQKWLKNEPDAMDWSQIIKMICELQGSGETWIEKQHMLQRKVKRVLEHDVMSSNPFSPITHPKADCLLLAHCIEHFVTDKKSYCDALKNVSSLLKSGGHLIMSAVLGATFYMCGDVKFPVLCMEEAFLKDALRGAGYVIQEDHMYLRKTESLYDMTDYKYGIILKACKEREM